jgi:queuosine precursor transporter
MLLFLTAISVSAVTLAGAAYARRYKSPDALIALYVLFCALSQIIATKIAAFDLGFTTVYAPAAVVVFAVTFLLTDIVNEKFGRLTVHRMIWITLLTQVALVLFLFLATLLPSAPFWTGQEAWNSLLGVVPRIAVASWLTFVVSENLDAYLFDALRRKTKGRHLWLRNVGSSAISLTVDTIFFITLAFAGTGAPLVTLMIGQFLIKYTVAVLDIPFMYANRKILGERLTVENDENTSA